MRLAAGGGGSAPKGPLPCEVVLATLRDDRVRPVCVHAHVQALACLVVVGIRMGMLACTRSYFRVSHFCVLV